MTQSTPLFVGPDDWQSSAHLEGEAFAAGPPATLVALGAGAGGLPALIGFLENVPADTGLALVIVAPLALGRRKRLAPLRQAIGLPVNEVTAPTPLQPDQIYVAPADHTLRLEADHLYPEPLSGKRGEQRPLDRFFSTMAVACGAEAVAVLLAGKGEDGIAGLQEVKTRGGWTLAQAPHEATQPALPRRALAAGVVDVVAPAGELAETVVKRRGQLAESPTRTPSDAETAQALAGILEIVHTQTGHDFGPYKRSTLLRRIARRMQMNSCADLPQYLKFLQTRPEEVQALFRDCLVSVTNFFRDPDAFDFVERSCIPQLFANKKRGDAVRVWVVGCATGEEAYSIAMLLSEQAARVGEPPRLQVFATDVDEEAIEVARRGRYSRAIAEDMTPGRLQRFMVKEENGYRVKSEIRELVLFAVHNVLKDPPFSNVDLICCRNLLIYFEREAQEKVFDLFHYAISPNGYLFLGTAESADGVSHLFTIRDKRCHLYQRRDSLPTPARRLPLTLPASSTRPAPTGARMAEPRPRTVEELYQSWTLRHYAPPRVLVDDRYEITYIFGGAERYLRERDGAVTQNILQKVTPGLRLELRAALFQALTTGEHITTRRLPVESNGLGRVVQLQVGPVDEPGFPKNYVEVVFLEHDEPQTGLPAASPTGEIDRAVINRLEEELLRTRERLQTIIEEHEIANQDLTVSNEELQSINEELKSTTEELEINKEELQSMNEELSTVNFELKLKLDELARANSDLQNLIVSTDVGAIFLDRALRLKRFTPRATELFYLIDADLGRPFAHLSHRLRYARLAERAAQVLESQEEHEEIVQSRDDRWFIVRLLPYRTLENEIDGLVITLIDITDLKRAEHELQQRVQQQAVAELGRQAVSTPDLTTLFSAATARAAAVLDLEFSQLLALEAAGEHFRLVAGSGWADGQVGNVTIPNRPNVLSGLALQSGEPVHVPDIRTASRFDLAPHLREHQVVSGLAVMVPGPDQPYGVLSVYSTEPRTFSHYDGDFLQAIANLLGAAIARDAAEQQIHYQARLLDAVEQSVVAMDMNGIIVYWNRFAETLYGWRAEEVLGRTITDIFIPDELREESRTIRRQLVQGESWAGEFTLKRRDGSLFPAYVTDSPIYDEQGRQIGVIGVSFDISERKAAEEALRASEQRFRQLADAMPQIVWANNADGQVVYLNEQWVEYTGLSLAESLPDPNQAVHPSDRATVEAIWREKLQERVAFEYELRLRRRDGSYRWHLARCVPVLDELGQLTRWFGTSTDIDDRVRAGLDRQLLSELDAQYRLQADPTSMIWATVSALGTYLEATLASFAEVDLAGQTVYMHRDWRHGGPGETGTFPLTAFLEPGLIVQGQQGQTLILNDIMLDERTRDRYAAGQVPLGVRSSLMVPCLRNGEWVGLLILAKAEPHQWRTDEILLLEAAATRLWTALEKVRAEAALRASEAELRLITDTVPGLIAYIDREECYRFVNATYGRWFGRPTSAIIGRRVVELLGEQGYGTVRGYIQRALAGETVTFENNIHYIDGPRTVMATYVPDVEADGEIQGFYALITDISERKQAERNQEFISALTAQISVLSEPQAIMQTVNSALGSYLAAARCHFNELELVDDQVLVLPEWRQGNLPSVAGRYRLSDFISPIVQSALEQGESIWVEDVATDPNTAAFAERYLQLGYRGYIAAPYIQDGRLVAMLAVASDEPRQWRPDEVALVETTMARVWPLIERTRSVAALRQSEERYRALIENAGEAVLVADLEGRYLEVNPSACALVGYSQQELLGKRVSELIVPAELPQLAAAQTILATGQTHVAEWTLQRKDGSRVLVEISAKILPDGRWQAFARDITERKRAEHSLHFLAEASTLLASSLDYETTLERVAQLAVPHIADWCAIDLRFDDGHIEAVAIAHVDPAKVAWGYELRRRYPIDPDAPVGVPNVIRTGVSDFYPVITDEMLEAAAQTEEDLQLLRTIGYSALMTVPLQVRERIFGAITFVATESKRRFTEADLAVAQDVARRAAVAIDNARLFRTLQVSEQNLRVSEERSQRQLAELQAVYATAPVGLAVLDTELRYVRINETLARMNGLPASLHIGKTARELLPTLSDRMDALAQNVLKTGEPLVNYEVSSDVPAAPGTERIWLQSLYPLTTAEGEIVALNAVVQDITERKRQEAELKQLNESLERRVEERTAELERSNRELDQFAYVASHDLKAPLRGIAQLASWITEDAAAVLPAASQEHLSRLQGRIRRMTNLLDDLLAYSRAGRLRQARETVDSAVLVRDLVETLAPPAGFQIRIQNPMPVLRTERVALELVLRNLLGNAIKHHHRGDGLVEVTVQERESFFEFAVYDDGPGIAPEFHQRIFEMFQTLQPRDRVEGSGMGLAIVKRILDARGGAITVESAVGAGTTFRFTWPKLNELTI